MKVQHPQALYGCNPELTVGRYSHVGIADAALRRGHAISSAKRRVVNRRLVAAFGLSKNGCGHPEDAVSSAEPYVPSLKRRHAEQIEILIHVHQLITLNVVDSLWRGERIEIPGPVFSQTDVTGIEDLTR